MLPISELYKYNIKSSSVIGEATFSPILFITYSNGVETSKIINRDILTGNNPYIEYLSIIIKLCDLYGFELYENYTEIYTYKSFLIYIDIIKMDIIVENTIKSNITTWDFEKIILYGTELFIEYLDDLHRETCLGVIENI